MNDQPIPRRRRGRIAVLAFVALGLVTACAVGGYVAGDSTDPTSADAAGEHQHARLAASTRPAGEARRAGYKRGLEVGQQKGRARGRKIGTRRGERAGAREAAEVTAQPAAPVTTTAVPEPSSGCPRGQIPRTQMGVDYCGPPPPTDCPPGEAPVNATSSCEPLPKGMEEYDTGDGGECIAGFRFEGGRCLPE